MTVPTVEEIAALSREAAAAVDRAYAPYSDFPVGAAVLTVGGGIHAGCNVENASLGLTICAERAAIFRSVQEEGPNVSLVAVYITCPRLPGSSSCGACRQVMQEFSKDADPLVFLDTDDLSEAIPLSALLPQPFHL